MPSKQSIPKHVYPPTARKRRRTVTDHEWLLIQLSRRPEPLVPTTGIEIDIIGVHHVMDDILSGKIQWWDMYTPYARKQPLNSNKQLRRM